MSDALVNTDGLGTALIYLADKIGITVSQMYEIYVKSQTAMATVQIIFILIWFIAVVSVMVITYKKVSKENVDRAPAYRQDELGLAIIFGIITATLMLIVLSFLYNPVIAYLCPEYTGLKSLMNDIGSIAQFIR